MSFRKHGYPNLDSQPRHLPASKKWEKNLTLSSIVLHAFQAMRLFPKGKKCNLRLRYEV